MSQSEWAEIETHLTETHAGFSLAATVIEIGSHAAFARRVLDRQADLAALDAVTEPRVKVLIDGTELEGWELRAAWDDFRLGLKHGNEFVKIAIHGNKRWQQMAARVGAWFVSGEVRYFDDREDALAWLND